jgi:hypothetical protein
MGEEHLHFQGDRDQKEEGDGVLILLPGYKPTEVTSFQYTHLLKDLSPPKALQACDQTSINGLWRTFKIQSITGSFLRGLSQWQKGELGEDCGNGQWWKIRLEREHMASQRLTSFQQ